MALKSNLFAEHALHHFQVDEFIVHSSRQNCLEYTIEAQINYLLATYGHAGQGSKEKTCL